MREITRTLTIRLPILAISITTGCALNFGQVNASGTVNASANANVDTKIDTTVNASGSTTVATTSVATPTVAPDPGPGTLYVHHVPKLSGPESSLGLFSYAQPLDGPVDYIYLQASQERNQIVIFVAIALEGTLPSMPIALVDPNLFSDGGSLRIEGTQNNEAVFAKNSGFMTIPAGKTFMASLSIGRSWAPPYSGKERFDKDDVAFFNANFLGKKWRFVIQKSTDIKTLSGAKIEGDFPHYGPLVSF